MKKIKALLAVLLTCCILASASGCIVQVNEEKNKNIVLAVIDGKYEILKKDYLPLFNYYSVLYSYYGMSITNDVRDQCLETLISEKILKLEMDEIEFFINDEDREKAREDFDEELKDLADQYEEEDDIEDSGRDYLQEAKDYYAKSFADSETTEEEYIDEIAETYRLERYKKFLMSDIVASDDEIKERYNTLKDEQTITPDMDADIIIYEPSGVSYKYITVSLTKEEMDEYNKLLEDDKSKAEDYMKDQAKKRAEEFFERIENGEKFEDLIDEANEYLKANCGVDEDDLVKSDEEHKLYKGGTTGIKGELDAKLLSLSTGKTTDILYTENGTYVIGKCYGRFSSVTHEYEVGNDIYNAIKEALEEEKRDEKWSDIHEDLIEKHTVKTYENRYHNKNY